MKTKKPEYSLLRIYLREINLTPLLSMEAERELAEKIAAGDPEARAQMVKANLRLVVNISRRYLGRGLSLEDLIEEGNLGLIRAAEGFDGGMGTKFATYASFWIKQSIRQALIRQGKLFRLPAYVVVLLNKWREMTAILTERLGRVPAHEEVRRSLRIPEKKMLIITQALLVSSLRAATFSDDDPQHDVLEALLDERGAESADMVSATEQFDCVIRKLEQLDRREAQVIRMRYGLGSFAPMTLREIGARMGLTRERVRQLQSRALVQLTQS